MKQVRFGGTTQLLAGIFCCVSGMTSTQAFATSTVVTKQEVEEVAPSVVTQRQVLSPASNINRKTCLAALKKLAKVRAVTTPTSKDVACLIDRPVQISTITRPSQIKLTANPTLDCYFATVLVNFLSHAAQPLANRHFDKEITGLISGSGFTCRRRNNEVFGKLSQHAFGNGIDINGFVFSDGSKFMINLDSKLTPKEQAFSKELRKEACRSFTTVLGPGYDKIHATHFHFDLARGKVGNAPRRICK